MQKKSANEGTLASANEWPACHAGTLASVRGDVAFCLESMAVCTSLKKVHVVGDFSREEGDAAATQLGEMLASNTTVEELVMAHCNISQEGVAALCEGLAVNNILRRLDLQDNPIRDSGSKRLAAMLEMNRSLAELNLRSCKIHV